MDPDDPTTDILDVDDETVVTKEVTENPIVANEEDPIVDNEEITKSPIVTTDEAKVATLFGDDNESTVSDNAKTTFKTPKPPKLSIGIDDTKNYNYYGALGIDAPSDKSANSEDDILTMSSEEFARREQLAIIEISRKRELTDRKERLIVLKRQQLHAHSRWLRTEAESEIVKEEHSSFFGNLTKSTSNPTMSRNRPTMLPSNPTMSTSLPTMPTGRPTMPRSYSTMSASATPFHPGHPTNSYSFQGQPTQVTTPLPPASIPSHATNSFNTFSFSNGSGNVHSFAENVQGSSYPIDLPLSDAYLTSHQNVSGSYAKSHRDSSYIGGRGTLDTPSHLLNLATKRLKFKKVTMMTVTFPPWRHWANGILTSCYLHGLTLIPSHQVPKTVEGWKAFDFDPVCQHSMRNAYTSFESSMIPNVNEDMTYKELNGICLAVTERWPSIVIALCSVLSSSICEDTLEYLKVEEINWASVRWLYFGVLQNFILSTDDAKNIRLKKFLSESKYQTERPPVSFAKKLCKEQKELNALFGDRVISDAMLKETYVTAIKEATGQLYENLFDTMDSTGISFQEFVTKIDNKWRKKQTKVVTNSLYSLNINTNSRSDNVSDSAFYSNNLTGKTSGNPKKDRQSSSAKDKPCFQFRDTGKCAFGKDCKYSHDKKTFATPLSSEDMAYQLRATNDLVLVAREKAVKYKKAYNKKLKKGPKGARKGGNTFTNYYEDSGTSKKNPKHQAKLAIDQVDANDNAVKNIDNDDSVESPISSDDDDDLDTTDGLYSDSSSISS